jgi:signal transduction histidine kinase
VSRFAILTARILREPRQVVASLRLLVFAGLAVLGASGSPVHPFAFWAVTVIYGLTVLGTLLARNAEHAVPRVRTLLFLFDAAMIACLIVVRGQQVQGLVMAYGVLLLMAAILVQGGSWLLNALFASAFYTVVTSWGLGPASLLAFDHLGPVFFFAVISVFLAHAAATARSAPATSLGESTARLRESRETLRANERLSTLGMLSAGIAHEIRSPVATLLASATEVPEILDDLEAALRARGDAGALVAELRAAAAESAQAAAQLRRIAEDLGALVRGGTPRIRAVDPAQALEGAARMLRPGTGDAVRVEVRSDATRAVRADPGRLLQVLLNLGGNAIEAVRSGAGGTVRLLAEDTGEDRVAFVVRDDGPGIPPDVQERMYDPFYTTKGPGRGTGLGLHLAREIVLAQAGSIACTSRPGAGASFRVELPATAVGHARGASGDRRDDAGCRARREDPRAPGAHAAA